MQAPDYSQSWNRFAYVFNNPLRLVDPTGYQSEGGRSSVGIAGEGNLGGKVTSASSGKLAHAPALGLTLDRVAGTSATNESTSEGPATPTQRAPTPNTADSKSLDTADWSTDAPGSAGQGPAGSNDDARSNREEWPDDGEWRKVPEGPSGGRVSNSVLEDPAFKGNPDAAVFWENRLKDVITYSPVGPEAAAAGLIWKLAGPAAKMLRAGSGVVAGARAINLPGWSKVTVDMAHVAERHIAGGVKTAGKTIFAGMNERGVKAAIRQAYGSATTVAVQGDRILLSGVTKTGVTVEMWLNRATNVIETAYPVSR